MRNQQENGYIREVKKVHKNDVTFAPKIEKKMHNFLITYISTKSKDFSDALISKFFCTQTNFSHDSIFCKLSEVLEYLCHTDLISQPCGE